MLRSMLSAFLMYSRIPVPQVEWKEENRRYSLGFFPAVGAVIGGALLLWRYIADRLGSGELLFGAAAVLIPVAVTGGIHLDGFCDVTDARASCADKAKRLEILSDPHIGSFSVIHLCLYLILQTAFFSQISSMKTAGAAACGFVLSRGLSGLSAVLFRSAKKCGTLYSFVKPAHKRTVLSMLTAAVLMSGTGMIFLRPVGGAAALAAALCTAAYCRHTAYKDFGGYTGDVCGWFLQLCELWTAAALVITDMLTEVIK